MKIISVPLCDLHVDPKNARKHDKKNIAAIKGSLKQFGQQKPIVTTAQGKILAGNGTFAAAKELGWERIDVVYSDLDTMKQKAFALADNRSAELAEWDDAFLEETLLELSDVEFDLGDIGFDDIFVKGHIRKGSKGNIDDDEVPPVAKNLHNVARGQVWKLGDHRLMCGDSTSEDDVAKLMDGKKADMVFTDPPYGVSYQSNMRTKSEKFDVIKNDEKFIVDWLPVVKTKSTGWVFIWTTWKVLSVWLEITKDFAEISNMIVWDKGGGGIGDLEKTFSTDYEIALVFHRGAKITGKRLGSVWSINKDASSEYVHPTQKPVALAEMAIENCTDKKSIVLDVFGGSGSTLIACEKTDRVNHSMELDEHYCSVIIERWQQFTGQEAVLVFAR